MKKAIYTIPTTTIVEFKTERIMAMGDTSAHIEAGGQKAPERSSKVF
jgi:hypothetical protein